MQIKDGIHVVGIDDAKHKRGGYTTHLIFVFCGGLFIESVMQCEIKVDGLNSTDMIIETLKPLKDKFQIILIHGVTTGGLNVVDIERINSILEKPVIAVTENKPTPDSIFDALKNLPDFEIKKNIIERAGHQYSVSTSIGKNKLYFQIKGIDERSARQFLKKFSVRSRLPEQLLLAHKIASGLSEDQKPK